MWHCLAIWCMPSHFVVLRLSTCIAAEASAVATAQNNSAASAEALAQAQVGGKNITGVPTTA
jgi:hypothetical protein